MPKLEPLSKICWPFHALGRKRRWWPKMFKSVVKPNNNNKIVKETVVDYGWISTTQRYLQMATSTGVSHGQQTTSWFIFNLITLYMCIPYTKQTCWIITIPSGIRIYVNPLSVISWKWKIVHSGISFYLCLPVSATKLLGSTERWIKNAKYVYLSYWLIPWAVRQVN